MKNFPMFLRMADRRALIIGGGEQAAQKARLILKTDAEVVVLAETLEAELQAYADEGRILHLTGPLTVELLNSAKLVFSATGCAGAGAAHAAIAKDVNALINVVDMPELCEAMSPSIVDRAPLIVAIGTEGSAPVLGRQIKTHIETMLEPNLGSFAAFSGRMRSSVAYMIDQNQRRNFWRWVFADAPRKAFQAGKEREAMLLVKDQIQLHGTEIEHKNSLQFITAAVPDSDLTTLRDVKKLQEADIIFYERGLHEPILELARRDAERVGYEAAPDTYEQMLGSFSSLQADGNDVVVICGQNPNDRGWG